MKKLMLLLLLASSAHADEYTNKTPLKGCYRNLHDTRCVKATFLNCTKSDHRNVKLYGPLIASMCHDMRVLEKELAEAKK